MHVLSFILRRIWNHGIPNLYSVDHSGSPSVDSGQEMVTFLSAQGLSGPLRPFFEREGPRGENEMSGGSERRSR